jgi:hypothetical protein
LRDIIAKLSGDCETRLSKDIVTQKTESRSYEQYFNDGCGTRHDSERRQCALHLVASWPRMVELASGRLHEKPHTTA